jgi:hypothetical protein
MSKNMRNLRIRIPNTAYDMGKQCHSRVISHIRNKRVDELACRKVPYKSDETAWLLAFI